METTFNWTINYMDSIPSKDGMSKIVKNISWTRWGNKTGDDGFVYSGNGFGILTCDEPSPEDFIPYKQLTKEKVCEWLEQNLNLESIDAEIEIQIENAMNPPVVKYPFPWENIPSIDDTEGSGL